MKGKLTLAALAWCLVVALIAIAYKGWLITAILLGTFAAIAAICGDLKITGSEEEPNGEEL